MASKDKMVRDAGGDPIQQFVPDPGKSQVPVALAGTYTFKNGTGGNLDVTGWSAVCVRSSAQITRYFGAGTTKTRTIAANTDTVIWLHPEMDSLVLSGTATIEIEGM